MTQSSDEHYPLATPAGWADYCRGYSTGYANGARKLLQRRMDNPGVADNCLGYVRLGPLQQSTEYSASEKHVLTGARPGRFVPTVDRERVLQPALQRAETLVRSAWELLVSVGRATEAGPFNSLVGSTAHLASDLAHLVGSLQKACPVSAPGQATPDR